MDCVGNNRLKYYSRDLNREGTLQILLISSKQSYLDMMANSIYKTREVQREKRRYNLKVHTCKTLTDVLLCMPSEFYVDYIIFILDNHVINCLAEVESNLNYIDSSFSRERICVVNPDFNYFKATVSLPEIWDFVKQYQFNLVNGKTKDQNKLFQMSKRLLNLAEACTGILNGIPMKNMV